MRKYIFVNVAFDKMLDPQIGIFKDLNSLENVEFKSLYINYSNQILEFIRRIFFSPQINRVVSNRFQYIFYNFLNENYDKNIEYVFIIPTMTLSRITLSCLKHIKHNNNNLKFVALSIDSLKAHSAHLDYARSKLFSDVWSAVLTFDKSDAEEYGFKYIGYCYYSMFEGTEDNNEKRDIFYIGFYKGGREKIIGQIFDKLNTNGIKCDFRVVSDKLVRIEGSSLNTINKKCLYPEVVSCVKSTNCVLEILQNDQNTQSIRYFEAVVYNKKLLTNNPNVFKLPYYNPLYMRYFQTIDDIDPEWIKTEETIDYGYRGDFSPVHLIDCIERLSL